MRIAVLALQGAFIEHEQMLSRLGVSSVEIRQKKDLEQSFDGMIIPGGESTVQGKLMRASLQGFLCLAPAPGCYCLPQKYKMMPGCILPQ